MEVKKLKRAIIKEEFVTITKDFMLAVILNQFVYWSDRVNDFDKMIEEERKIASKEGIELNQPLKHGWIYKKAEELIEETMLGISQTSMRNKIKLLVKMGFLTERDNPNYKWDHTKQYRVNFQKLKDELSKHGYSLQGYKVLETPENIESQNLSFESQTATDRISKFELHNSEFEEQYQRLHSEITNKEKSIKEKVDSEKQSFSPSPTEKKESGTCQKVVDSFNKTCTSLPQVRSLTDKRKRAIKLILKKYSLKELETVFKKVEESAFLNGNSDKWSGATFDWILKESNFIKVLEGNYDDKGKYNNLHSKSSYDIEEYEKLGESHYLNLNHFLE